MVKKLFEIRSKNEGVLSYLNWHSISRGLIDLSDHYDHISRNVADNYHGNDNLNSISNDNINEGRGYVSNNSRGIWMELSKSVGDNVRKNDVLAEIYDRTDQQNPSNYTDTSSVHTVQKPVRNNETQEYDNQNLQLNQDDNVKRCRNEILSGMEITPDRSYDKEPFFGIELLRTLAVKSAAMHDTDVVKSTIAGLFRVLIYTLTNEEKIGMPFRLQSGEIEKQKSRFSYQKSTNVTHLRRHIIINPNEQSLRIRIMDELSVIINTAVERKHLHIINQFINEYISMSFVILELEPQKSSEQFAVVTEWFAEQVLYAHTKFPDYLRKQITTPIIDFYNNLRSRSPQASRTFLIYMRSIVDC